MTDQTLAFDVPSTTLIHKVLARLVSLQLRRAFYAKLANPHWVAALRGEKVFSSPPAVVFLEDGSSRVDPWPEIDYLVRMAPLEPIEVAKALEEASHSDNPWVRRGIWEASSVLPAAGIAPLVPEMKAWADGGIGNSRTDPRDVARTIVNLLEGGQHKSGARLAAAFYGPRAPESPPEFGLPEPRSGIEPYWYADTLPRVSAALGNSSRLHTLRGWLEKYQLEARSFDPELGEDTSYLWRPSVTGSRENYGHEIGSALVEATRSAGLEAARVAPKAIDTLLASRQPLLRRIALDVLADRLNELEPSNHQDKRAQEALVELFDRANALVGDATVVEQTFRVEYVKFLRSIARWSTQIDVSQLGSIIDAGPAALRDVRRARFAQEGDTEAQTDARIGEYLVAWQHRLLASVGLESLSGALKDRLAALNVASGAIENPLEPSWEIRSGGPTSPVSVEEMEAMSDEALLEHLAQWHPVESGWDAPTHEGQGQILADVVGARPERFVLGIEQVKSLRPTYIRAIFRGWQLAVEAGRAVPWEFILRLSVWVASYSDDVAVENEGGEFDDDRGFRSLKFQVAQLLDSTLRLVGAEPPVIPPSLLSAVGEVLTFLAEHPEPKASEGESFSDGSDPLTRSLNTIRPVALRGLIRLVHRYPESPAASASLSRLEEYISPRDSSLAVAAVFGEGFGRLYDAAKPWALANTPQLFGTEEPSTPQQQVALSTGLAVHGYHPVLLELWRAAIEVALAEMNTDTRVTGWTGLRSFNQLLGDWILLAVVTGKIEFEDDLLVGWNHIADPEIRGDVLGHLGWQMRQWSSVEDETRIRAGQLWDSRVVFVREHREAAAELDDFYWFVRSGKFEPSWWLPRLLEVTTLVPDFKTRGMIGEQLATASNEDPSTALSVLENLLSSAGPEVQTSHYDLDENATPQVLATAFDSGDARLAARADLLMNRMAASGYLDLEERVRSRRQPTDPSA